MDKAGDSTKAPTSDDRMQREWSKARSSLHESEHRFNAWFAQQEFAGKRADPEKILKYFMRMYERAVQVAVKTVTDHESAVACCKEFDTLMKRMLKVTSKLIPELLQPENGETSKAVYSELRQRLLVRTEHWKAEAHRFARQVQQSRGPFSSKFKPGAVPIMHGAMERQGLNPAKLAVKVLAILRRTGKTGDKVDRTTIYRIIAGSTKKPQPQIRNALIAALALSEDDAAIVFRELAGPPRTRTSKSSKSPG